MHRDACRCGQGFRRGATSTGCTSICHGSYIETCGASSKVDVYEVLSNIWSHGGSKSSVFNYFFFQLNIFSKFCLNFFLSFLLHFWWTQVHFVGILEPSVPTSNECPRVSKSGCMHRGLCSVVTLMQLSVSYLWLHGPGIYQGSYTET